MDSRALGFAKQAMDVTDQESSSLEERGLPLPGGARGGPDQMKESDGDYESNYGPSRDFVTRLRSKQAGIASMLGRVAKKVITPKNIGRAALVGAGTTGGVMATKSLQRQRPMASGALSREKRRSEIARFGTL